MHHFESKKKTKHAEVSAMDGIVRKILHKHGL